MDMNGENTLKSNLAAHAARFLVRKDNYDPNLDRLSPQTIPPELRELAQRWELYHQLRNEVQVHSRPHLQDSQSAQALLAEAEAEWQDEVRAWTEGQTGVRQ